MSSKKPQNKNNKNIMGRESADGQAFQANPNYLKQLSKKDHMHPCLKPLVIIAVILIVWWVIVGIVYSGTVMGWLDTLGTEISAVVGNL